MLLDALTLQAGYNAALVAVGAGLLGAASGAAGTFLFLRKRALVADAVAHATLPGIALAFILAVALGGDGRALPVLLAGSAVSAALGLVTVEWIARHTRLSEDAAIGAVLSVFFGVGVVLLTVIQSMADGRQAGLEDFLLGATAGMVFQDALLIAAGGTLTALAILILRRPMTLVAFDADYAAASGVNVARIDLAMMALVMAVTVVGLKIVGLILIVALLIIPAVTARFWTERTEGVLWIAALLGGLSGYLGAALSASAPALPTGPIVVLTASALFALSLLIAPRRGVLAALLRHRRFQTDVHRRQGLLALARGEAIHDPLTLRVLTRAKLIRPDGVATADGQAQAAKAVHDEARWALVRANPDSFPDSPGGALSGVSGRYDGLTSIETLLTADEIAEIDRRLAPPQGVR
ncbi:MAG: metal ABC transporter permease [Pseudomonadota bacterium]